MLAIKTEAREIKCRKTNKLRAQGKVPAIVYGFEIEPVCVELDRNELERLYSEAGESTVVELGLGSEKHNVLIQEIQRDPISGLIVHADFRRIDMNKKVEATIDLEPVGESPAVKELGGTLIQPLEYVEVLALPIALVREIKYNISKLVTFDDVIRVRDLEVPDGIEVITEPEVTIALVQPPRSDEEMQALDKEVVEDIESVQVESEKKEEEGTEEAASEENKEK